MSKSTIIWTKIDEAPALASYSLLPILRAFTKAADIEIEERDISLAGRIIANFPDNLSSKQQIPDHLTKLGQLAKTPAANIVKLPNISASIPQLKAAIKELQAKGYDLPDYPDNPQTPEEKKLKERFAVVLGSAVNPVLREGNSDRRAPASVKKFSQKHPHTMMKPWSKDSQTKIAHMESGDFYETESSTTLPAATTASITYLSSSGQETVLKSGIQLQAGEIIDSSVMHVAQLRTYFQEQIEEAKKKNLLLSLHLKATMMKISDPIMYGYAVSVYYQTALEKHQDTLKKLEVNLNNGIGDLYAKIKQLPADEQELIKADIEAVYQEQPALAMVDSDKGITNLHVPNNVIIDASVPVVIRDGGQMWGPDGQLHDTLALIPDRSYAPMYQVVVEDCQKNGAFDPATMGSVSNVGLMAQKAEEYGSHDKTFEAPGTGTIKVTDESGQILLEQQVEPNDIFRMCQVKHTAVENWVKLAITRAKASGAPVVFWLNKNRAHDAEVIKKVNAALPKHDTDGLEIKIMAPVEAMKYSLERIRQGKDTISATGNVLRDYLTDLFPILELGTSARMLSIIPLMNGGGLFETGAGGSAPKHVEQFEKEGHLRWDSLGEFCALAASFEHIATTTGNQKATILSQTLDQAIVSYLENKKAPSRKVGELDSRGSHFYLALYWAKALAAATADTTLQQAFTSLATELAQKEDTIINELNSAQGQPVDVGGYFQPDEAKASKAMRPSNTFNQIIDKQIG